jgi:hypothetical protein
MVKIIVLSGKRDWYILQPEKGVAFHSDDFNRIYVDGFFSVNHSHSDADEST